MVAVGPEIKNNCVNLSNRFDRTQKKRLQLKIQMLKCDPVSDFILQVYLLKIGLMANYKTGNRTETGKQCED